jgi:hypothetical protein
MRPRAACFAALLLIGTAWNPAAHAEEKMTTDEEVLAERWTDLTLSTSCEAGFQQFIHMAQTGQLGDDVTNANVGIFKNHARVELVRAGAPSKRLLLTPRDSTQTITRYFSIVPGEGATASDVARVAKALDEAFKEDPFQLAYDFFNALPRGDPIPNFTDAWTYGGWRGVLRVVERRMVALAGVRYTIAVIVVLTAALVASVFLLWSSEPPPS